MLYALLLTKKHQTIINLLSLLLMTIINKDTILTFNLQQLLFIWLHGFLNSQTDKKRVN